ncbi:CLAVATA3/ESR (CLE)-related protein 16 [Prosopis cineraria]|uniref:CLAVATA3/ESR (CLE)-related protein 16 n=1 Tax=Prosopis cineraria TaxID=364024 RepID=UPI00241096D5|nr:CLAVATA3/ESR (CLE)-related protein 16 [Prosopis cineraria]
MTAVREIEKARSERRVSSGARAVIFFCSFAVFCLFLLTIHGESRSSYFMEPPSPTTLLRTESASTFRTRRALFHGSSSSTKAQTSIYEEDKRLIRTGPNPLHN